MLRFGFVIIMSVAFTAALFFSSDVSAAKPSLVRSNNSWWQSWQSVFSRAKFSSRVRLLSFGEINIPSVAGMENISVVGFSSIRSEEVSALVGAQLLLYERELRLKVALAWRDEVEVMEQFPAHSETQTRTVPLKDFSSAAEKLRSFLQENELRLEVLAADGKRSVFGSEDFHALLDTYMRAVRAGVSDNWPPLERVLSIDRRSVVEQVKLILVMNQHNTPRTETEILARLRVRGSYKMRSDFRNTLLELENIWLDASQIGLHLRELVRTLDISIAPAIPSFGRMTSLGLIVRAEIYDYAAWVAALHGDEEGIHRNLQRIINLHENDDHVRLSVQMEDGAMQKLTEHSLNEIADLYQLAAARVYLRFALHVASVP